MATAKTKDATRPVDLGMAARVVIKFHDHLNVAHDEATGIISNTGFPWMEPEERSRYLKIEKLITSIHQETINKIVSSARKLDLNYDPPNLNNYWGFSTENLDFAHKAVDLLQSSKEVDLAYVENISTIPPAVVTNPLFSHQDYLGEAPFGINARHAWKFKGGQGQKIRYVDIEQGWKEEHEDMGMIVHELTGFNHPWFKDHGTAVLGVIGMLDNDKGGIGIAPQAEGIGVSQWRTPQCFNTADAIMSAISYLNSGDVLLLEAQAWDDRSGCGLPVEIYELNFQLIRLATCLGITVIVPAGNGNNVSAADLDLFEDNCGKATLHRKSKDFRDSGAILVAAAYSITPHHRMSYSNFGTRVDCFAWGENVVTAGSYPRSSGATTDTYTTTFGGTSSASATICGAAILVQSLALANKGRAFHPLELRRILSDNAYGTRSANGRKKDKIGVMPDLEKIIKRQLSLKVGDVREYLSHR